MKPSSSLPAAVKEQIRQIYADLEARPLPRTCQLSGGCCHFRLTGRTPSVTRSEALFAAVGVRAAGRIKLQPHPDGACPCLGKDGRCTIYQHRPFGCRTHFCEEAGGMYPRKHVADLIRRLEALDVSIGWRDGPRDFPDALEDALDTWR